MPLKMFDWVNMMPAKFLIVLCSVAAFASGCASSGTVQEPASTSIPAAPVEEAEARGLDLDLLERTLQMDRAKSSLGFEEKSFDPCELKLQKTGCARQFLVVMNFQLQCRDIDGTVENYEVEPIHAEHIKWALGKTANGVTATDHEGFGKVRLVAPNSVAKQKLRLTYKNDFLIVNASELRRIVTPPEWCRKL